MGYRGEENFHARVGFIDVLVQVGFDYAVVVDPQSLADRILCDLEAAIDVSPQGRGEIKSNGKRQRFRLEARQQRESAC